MENSVSDFEKFSVAARDDIGESRADIKVCKERVKEIISVKYGAMSLPSDADALIERCLRARKFDTESLAAMIHSYFKLLANVSKMHGEECYFVPSLHRGTLYESGAIALLNGRDSKGRALILFDYDKMPVHTFSFDKAFAAFILLLNEVNRISVLTQRVGMVWIVNMKEFGFGHAKQYTISRIRALASLARGAFPQRLKGVHAIGANQIVRALYSLFTPFLGEKIKHRVHLYGNDLTTFHEHLDPNILPKCMGGNLEENQYVDMSFLRHLYSMDEYYAGLFQHGYMNKSN